MPHRHLSARFALPLALLLASLALPARPAAAAGPSNSTIVTSLQTGDLKAILDDMGIEYQQDKDGAGDPTFTFKPGSYNLVLFVYGKDEATGAYGSLQMYVGFSTKASLDEMNEWNAKRRFIRAYRSEAGGSRLESDLDLTGGVTVGAVKTFVHKFQSWADAFASHIAGGD